MSTQAERVLALLKARGLTDRQIKPQLAKVCGATYQSAQQWLNGDTKSIAGEYLAKIARHWGANLDWLVTGVGSMDADEPNMGKPPRLGEVWNSEDELDGDEYLFVPRLDMSVPCGDGKPMFHIDEKGQRQAFRRLYLERIGANPKTIATVTAEGNSMAPRIQHDDSLAIDYSQSQLRDDYVFVFVYRDQWYIKRLFRNPGGGIRVVSDNPDKSRYPDWYIELEQMVEFRVMARVVCLSGTVA